MKGKEDLLSSITSSNRYTGVCVFWLDGRGIPFSWQRGLYTKTAVGGRYCLGFEPWRRPKVGFTLTHSVWLQGYSSTEKTGWVKKDYNDPWSDLLVWILYRSYLGFKRNHLPSPCIDIIIPYQRDLSYRSQVYFLTIYILTLI